MPGPWVGHRVEHEDHHRGANQHPARLGIELARELPDQEQHDRHRHQKNDFLRISHLANAQGERDCGKGEATEEYPPIDRRRLESAPEQRGERGSGMALARQNHARHRYRRDQQRQFVDAAVSRRPLVFGERGDTVEQQDVHHRDDQRAADDRHPAERLHGGVHQAALRIGNRPPLVIQMRRRLDRHRVGDHVLHHTTDWGKQGRKYLPGFYRHQREHGLMN